MDRLLTPLVTRVLQQYVKRSAEGAGSDLKVSTAARSAAKPRTAGSCRGATLAGALPAATPAAPTPNRHAVALSSRRVSGLTTLGCRSHACPAAPPCCEQVSFSRGNVLTLHNLELNLAPLLGGAAALAHVRRAFARRLSITLPWTALTSQPIQARAGAAATGCSAVPVAAAAERRCR